MLSGKLILDLSWVLGGPFAGQLLAQLGAEVVKVENPLTSRVVVLRPQPNRVWQVGRRRP